MKQYEKEYYAFQTRARGLLSTPALKQRFEKLRRWYHCRLGRFLPVDKDARCLDLPCGYGNFLYFLRSEGFTDVRGIDSDEDQVRLAHMLELNAEQGDAFDELSGADEKYAMISSLDFIEHLPRDDAMRFLSLCHDALRPGGCLILRTPSANGPFGSHDVWNDLTHQWGLTSSLLRAILEMKGFDRIELLDERPQPSSIIDTLRWLVYFPSKWMANAVSIMLGMSPPDVWSRSMIAVAYKPGGDDVGRGSTTRHSVRTGTDAESAGELETTAPESTASNGVHTRLVRNWGLAMLYPRPLLGLLHTPRYFLDFLRYRRLNSGETVMLRDSHPCLHDRVKQTPFDPHYFYQGGWLSRYLNDAKPALHVDVGSSVMMASVLSGMVKTVCVDYRPLHAELEGLSGIAGNIVKLPFSDDSLDSVSSLHVIEHVGLGRYGDGLDADGSRKAAAELARVLKPGGRLYVSAPVGRARVCFNAHRVFSPFEMQKLFDGLELLGFAYVDDEHHFHGVAEPVDASAMEYACGMFIFGKKGERN